MNLRGDTDLDITFEKKLASIKIPQFFFNDQLNRRVLIGMEQ